MLNSAEHEIYSAYRYITMPTVGNLIFISRINDWFGDLNLKIPLILVILIFRSILNFMLSRVEHEKKFYNLGAW